MVSSTLPHKDLMMPQLKKSQSDKFREAARQLEIDCNEEQFNEKLRKLAKQSKTHASDCSKHNAPAYEANDCDCGSYS